MPILATDAAVLRGAVRFQANLTAFDWANRSDLQEATDFGDVGRSWVP